MIKYILLVFFLSISFSSYSNENLLTLQQQIERLQREVSDLSKTLYSDDNNENNISDQNISSFSALDIRLYDLEKDVKNLNALFEEILFQIDDFKALSENLELSFQKLEQELINNSVNKNEVSYEKQAKVAQEDVASNQDNTLGTIIISDENINTNSLSTLQNDEIVELANLTPEQQFQKAFDNIREKKYLEARQSLNNFINNNPENQMSGTAHYWLGELFILENKYRDAALIFAEGLQNYPESIKAPDMLFKLANSLIKVEKKEDACRTMNKFLEDYPNKKNSKNARKFIIENSC